LTTAPTRKRNMPVPIMMKPIKQKASKKFAGKRKKKIRCYTSNTRLDIESGESVDYLQAAITKPAREDFGRTAKFGSSVLLNAPIGKTEIGLLLDKVAIALASPPIFSLPRTARITDEAEVVGYDALLLDAIIGDDSRTEFTHSGHDIVGVDFVFSGNEKYTLTARHHRSRALDDADLDLETLRCVREGGKHTATLGVRLVKYRHYQARPRLVRLGTLSIEASQECTLVFRSATSGPKHGPWP
jgi:hypothetical protein